MSSAKQLIAAIVHTENEKVCELSEAMDAGEINKVVWGTTALYAACGGCNDQALV